MRNQHTTNLIRTSRRKRRLVETGKELDNFFLISEKELDKNYLKWTFLTFGGTQKDQIQINREK